MNKDQAIDDIEAIFSSYKAITPTDRHMLQALNSGKIYELFVLSELLCELRSRGFTCAFSGSTLKFKAAPGLLKLSDPHFEIMGGDQTLWLFVDIEFQSLGSTKTPVSDFSGFHELDLILVNSINPRPAPNEIVLGVECKCVANFQKKLIKEALGVRRELSYLAGSQMSALSRIKGPVKNVSADPASEFWLAYIDPRGDDYKESPDYFSVELRHMEPHK